MLPPDARLRPPEHCDAEFGLEVVQSAAGKPERVVVLKGSRPLSGALSVEDGLRTLSKRVQLYIAQHSRDAVFVHAGVVVRNGQAVVIPGPSHAGKTTLVASLVEAGATYFSDEFAVIGKDGNIRAFPVQLGMRRPDGERDYFIPKTAALAGSTASPSVVLFANYRSGSVWSPARLRPAVAVLQTMCNAVGARTHPELVLNTIQRLALRTVAYAGERGNAVQVCDWLANSATP